MTTLAPTPPPAPRTRAHPPRGLLLVVLIATFMTALDFFIVNVAVPSMQRRLGASTTAIQWIVRLPAGPGRPHRSRTAVRRAGSAAAAPVGGPLSRSGSGAQSRVARSDGFRSFSRASSPLTKAGDSSVENSLAISTASSRTTASGTLSSQISS